MVLPMLDLMLVFITADILVAAQQAVIIIAGT
jgi:hypothetical protein